MSHEATLGLVGTIYDAALEPAAWKDAVDQLASALDAHRIVMFTPGAEAARQFWVSHDVAPDLLAGYAEHFHTKDLWTLRGVASGAPTGWNRTGEMLVAESEYRASEFWNDFTRPLDMFRLATVVVDGGDAELPRTHLSVFGPERRAAFDAQTTTLLERIAPHVRRSLLVRQALADLRTRVRALESALLDASTPTIACDREGRIVLVNAPARRLLDERTSLLDEGARVACANPAATATLRHLIVAASAANRGAVRTGGTARIPRVRSGKPVVAIVTPLAPERRFAVDGIEVSVLIIVHDPETSLGATRELLRTTFALTPAEVRLVEGLVQGASLREVARRLGVGYATVRTQLRSVFEKTGTHRQAELVGLVHALRRADPGSA